MAKLQEFEVGDVIVYRDSETAKTALTNMVKENIEFLTRQENQKYYLNADGSHSKQGIIDQYKYFLDNIEKADQIKTISVYKVDPKQSSKVDSRGNPYTYNAYTLSVKYIDKEGKAKCLFIYNLYSFLHLPLYTTEADKAKNIFELKPKYLYLTLNETLTTFLNLDVELEKADDKDTFIQNLKASFAAAQSIIDDIPESDKETGELLYAEHGPAQAVYMADANIVETAVLASSKLQREIISKIVANIAEADTITGQFGDSSHATLHPGPGLGNSDLILACKGTNYPIELKNIFRANTNEGLADAAMYAHNQPYMLAFVYHKKEIRLYKLENNSIKDIENPLLRSTEYADIFSKLFNPDQFPKTYTELYEKIDTALKNAKAKAEQDGYTEELINLVF